MRQTHRPGRFKKGTYLKYDYNQGLRKMRSEQEIICLIKNLASSDNRILAAYMKGSRTNPHIPKDRIMDFDIMYVVTETASFIEDTSWMDSFGKIILKQEQKNVFGYGERFGIMNEHEQMYSWLLIFDDGNRIDVGVETLPNMLRYSNRNGLYMPLVDKFGYLPDSTGPSDEEFHIKCPDENRFACCVNEFFWSLCDVIKGIARDELPFAMTTYNTISHLMLEKMLEWHIGCDTGFALSCGKLNKFFKKHLPPDIYRYYVNTYSGGSNEQLLSAIGIAYRLFHETALSIAKRLGYRYPQEYQDGFLKYSGMVCPAYPDIISDAKL